MVTWVMGGSRVWMVGIGDAVELRGWGRVLGVVEVM